MKFQIEGTRIVVTTVTVIESISGEIDITKKTVMEETGCEAIEDGDSTAWYGYVEESTRVTTEFDEPPDVEI